jgi:hypothetical protein
MAVSLLADHKMLRVRGREATAVRSAEYPCAVLSIRGIRRLDVVRRAVSGRAWVWKPVEEGAPVRGIIDPRSS